VVHDPSSVQLQEQEPPTSRRQLGTPCKGTGEALSSRALAAVCAAAGGAVGAVGVGAQKSTHWLLAVHMQSPEVQEAE